MNKTYILIKTIPIFLFILAAPANAQTAYVSATAQVRNVQIIHEICERGQIDDCIQVFETTEEEAEMIKRVHTEAESNIHDQPR